MRGVVARLALRDLAREPAHVFCILALIAGTLAPLLLLFAIKTGVSEILIGRLHENPRIREMTIVGNNRFDDSDHQALAAWDAIAFVVPEQRSIARRMSMRVEGARAFEPVVLITSGPGDPLLPPGLVLGEGQLAVSPALAEKFELAPGDAIQARATRGQPPTARLALDFEVAAVLPRGWLTGSTALVDRGFQSQLESFYDDYAVPELGIMRGRDPATRETVYESFRVYARDITDVEALEGRLEERLRTQVKSEVAQIRPLLGLSRDVNLALNVLAACAASGLAAALTALFWSNVERKRLTLAVLALMGARPGQLALFPLVQAVAYALGGAALALGLVLAGAAVLQALFADALGVADEGRSVAPLGAGTALGVAGGLLALALLAAAVAARRAAAADPALAIRSGG